LDRGSIAAPDVLDDHRAVDPQLDGLPDCCVLAEVESARATDVKVERFVRTDRRPRDAEPAMRGDRGRRFAWDVEGRFDRPRLERECTRIRVGDELERDPLQPRLRAPVTVPPLDDDFAVAPV